MQVIPFFSGALNFEDSAVLILLLHDEKLISIMSLFEDAGRKEKKKKSLLFQINSDAFETLK